MKFNKLSEKHYLQYKNLINSNITEKFFTNFINNVLNDNHIIMVLEDEEDKIIGTGTILIEEKLTYGGCKMGHIENILINENYRKRGYGEHIVKKLLELCKHKKCYRVDLNCSSELENFYKKNGFNKKHICMNVYFKENFV